MGKGNGPGRQGGSCDRDPAAIGAAGSARRGDCTTRSGRLGEGVGRPAVRPARSLPSHWLRQEQARVEAGGVRGRHQTARLLSVAGAGVTGACNGEARMPAAASRAPPNGASWRGSCSPQAVPEGSGGSPGAQEHYLTLLFYIALSVRAPFGCSRTGDRTRFACLFSRLSYNPSSLFSSVPVVKCDLLSGGNGIRICLFILKRAYLTLAVLINN